MLSFGTDGRAGYWNKNLTKYLTEVSHHLVYCFARESSLLKILCVPDFNCCP